MKTGTWYAGKVVHCVIFQAERDVTRRECYPGMSLWWRVIHKTTGSHSKVRAGSKASRSKRNVRRVNRVVVIVLHLIFHLLKEKKKKKDDRWASVLWKCVIVLRPSEISSFCGWAMAHKQNEFQHIFHDFPSFYCWSEAWRTYRQCSGTACLYTWLGIATGWVKLERGGSPESELKSQLKKNLPYVAEKKSFHIHTRWFFRRFTKGMFSKTAMETLFFTFTWYVYQ